MKRIVGCDSYWHQLDCFLRRLQETLFSYRVHYLTEKIITLSTRKGILGGPFKGMKYPQAISAGSTILPKLLGTYEAELSEVFRSILAKGYQRVIDIGCAEGYYAIGLASRLENLEVFAFDISVDAQRLCQEMALANGVQERVYIGGECSAEYLSEFDYLSKSLILSDCEGAEKELFNESNRLQLAGVDILVETHDFLVPEVSVYLRNLFEESHCVKVINSISDSLKPDCYECPFVDEKNSHLREIIFSEGRPDNMQWLFLESRK